MINNNMGMIQQMDNLADYDEYVELCKKSRIEIRDLSQFCMGIGVLFYGLNKYGRENWQDAYTKAFRDINEQDKSTCCGNEKKDKPLPPLLTQARNFAISATQHIKDGGKTINEETYMNRMAVCDDCESMRSDGRCSECGCYMKIKARWAEQKCPLNKW